VTLAPGTRLGAYDILAQIGAGGIGEVYQARDRKLERDVAIKVLSRGVAADRVHAARFRREAQMLAAVNHPNIATVFGFEELDDLQCLVMELVPGETLAERLKHGRMPAPEAIRIGAAVAEALESAHRQGITHRDIKAANVKVTPDGRVKVLDFGLAKLATNSEPAGDASEAVTLTAMTRVGDLAGTPAYMSPEQLRGEAVDQRADVWAFGCLMFELVAGRRPFGGASVAEVIASILTVEPAWTHLPVDTPVALRDLLRRCLQKDRSARLADIAQARAELASGTRPAEPRTAEQTAASVRSLAVLPFVNMSGDGQMDYLSDGLTQNITFSLSQLPQLRVMSQSAVARHKGGSDDAVEIGRTLGVPAVVAGRVRQRGGALLISAELMDVATGWQIWGAQYRKPADDIFAIEEDIAREICDALRLKFSPDTQELIARRRAENVEAYHLYLKGRFHWGKRTGDGLAKGLEYFRQAIEVDPTYALAHAGIAEIYVVLTHYCYLDPRQAMPKARAAANRALEIEPEMCEALTVLGAVKANYEWDLAGCERVLRQAIAHDPKYARARQTLAECLITTGRFDEGLAEVERALHIDPLSLHMNAAVVMDCFFTRQYDAGIDHGRRAVDLDVNFFPSHYYLGLICQQAGRLDDAVAHLERARTLSNGCPLVVASLGAALAAAGRADTARGMLRDLDAAARTGYVSPTTIAAVHVALGETVPALDQLDRAFDQRCAWLLRALMGDPRFDPLRGERRFQDLVARVSSGSVE
jgi:serine/threonine protein kinase/tetratricopeptide (TPR) repeat protein